MAGRPGPAPKDPSARKRTNADPFLEDGEWTKIPYEPNDGEIPSIPMWVEIPDDSPARMYYNDLMLLPQARLWRSGDIMNLWMALPYIHKYLTTSPGAEGMKAIASTLNLPLRLTADDLQKARVAWEKDQEAVAEEEAVKLAANVTSIAKREGRRNRLTGSTGS